MSGLIGVDLGGTKIEAALVDARTGDVLWRQRSPTPQQDYPATLAAIRALLDQLRAQTGAMGPVGIATPGSPSPADGRMRNCNSTCLNERCLQQDLEQSLGCAVRIANDADCLALSEAVDGAAQGAGSVFGVILGTGVGGGLVVNRQLLAGPNRIAGEWGHNPMPVSATGREQRTCYCGRSNCVETWLCGPALAQEWCGDARADLRQLVATYRSGDPAAVALLERWFERLAIALSVVINIVDPEVIVLGGGLSNIEPLYEQVPARWSSTVFSDVVLTRLVPARFGDSSGVRGAARLWEMAPSTQAG